MDSRPHRLLVVEDQPFFSDILGEVLTSSGFDVRTASDGERALRIAAEFLPHLVVLDIDMPGMSGLEVLRRLRLTWTKADMAVLMASGRADEPTIAETVRLGADAFLKKPYAISQVVHRACALMEALEPS